LARTSSGIVSVIVDGGGGDGRREEKTPAVAAARWCGSSESVRKGD